MKKIGILIAACVLCLCLVSCGFRVLPSGKIRVVLPDGRTAKIEGFLTNDGNALFCDDDQLDISSLQPGPYELVLWGKAADAPEEVNEFFWAGLIHLSLQEIHSGRILRPETWEKVEILTEERQIEDDGRSFFARFVDANHTTLYGPFPLNRTVAVHAELVDGIVVQDVNTRTQITQRIDWEKTEKSYTVDYSEDEISYLTVAFNRSEISPESLHFTALPTEEHFTVFGGEAGFENHSSLFELSYGQWEAYRWEASFSENGTTYQIRSHEPFRLDWSYFLTMDLGGSLHLGNAVRPYYTARERLQVDFRHLILDTFENTVRIFSENRDSRCFYVSLEREGQLVFSGQYAYDELFEYPFEDTGNYSLEISVDTEAWQGMVSREYPFEVIKEEGAFKIANSFGKGGWENVPDGFLWMTYEAMKQSQISAWIVDRRRDYSPTALAVIEIAHEKRRDITISIGTGDPEAPIATKTFFNYVQHGGDLPFPDNKIVLDITDLVPIQGEAVTIGLFDSDVNEETGTLRSFSVEVYDDADQNPIRTYHAPGLPLPTQNCQTLTARIEGVEVSGLRNASLRSTNQASRLFQSSRIPTREEFEAIQRDHLKMAESGSISEEQWEKIYAHGLIRVIDAYVPENRQREEAIDLSASKYFPPIGDQGDKNACVAWSTGYYVTSYYNAWNHDWDLSGAEWIADDSVGYPSPAYWDKLMSPDFIYHQINKGVDDGSAYIDAYHLIVDIGACTWDIKPYALEDYTSYPSEAAWRNAPFHRQRHVDPEMNAIYYVQCATDEQVEIFKNLLRDGYLFTIAVNSNFYHRLSQNDLWHTRNYDVIPTNHANTVVGFDDAQY